MRDEIAKEHSDKCIKYIQSSVRWMNVEKAKAFRKYGMLDGLCWDGEIFYWLQRNPSHSRKQVSWKEALEYIRFPHVIQSP